MFAINRDKAIHATVKTSSNKAVSLCKADISTVLPIVAIARPLDSKFEIWSAMLGNEQYRVEQQ